MLGTFVLTMRNNYQEDRNHDVTQTDAEDWSWYRFTRRTSCKNTQIDNGTPKDSVWLYVGVSVLYFVIIGVVLLILLFGPQWRPMKSLDFQKPPIIPPEEEPNVEHNEGSHSQNQPSSPDASDYISTFDSKETFQGSVKDPLYDIDPRSSIFRGGDDHHVWIESSGKAHKENHVEIRKAI